MTNNLDSRVVQIIKLLGDNHEPDKIIEAVSRVFDVSTQHLRRIFKLQTGKSILQYVKDLRLEKVKLLLESKNSVSVKEVCFELGFSDYSHFLRDFKKKYGTSPKKFQKQVWLRNLL